MTPTDSTPTPQLDPAILDVLDRVDWRTMKLVPSAFTDDRKLVRTSDVIGERECPLEAAFSLGVGMHRKAPVAWLITQAIVCAADEHMYSYDVNQDTLQAVRAEMLRRIDLKMPAQRIEVVVTNDHVDAGLAAKAASRARRNGVGWDVCAECAAGQACAHIPGFSASTSTFIFVDGHQYVDQTNNLSDVVTAFDGAIYHPEQLDALRARLPLTLDLRLTGRVEDQN